MGSVPMSLARFRPLWTLEFLASQDCLNEFHLISDKRPNSFLILDCAVSPFKVHRDWFERQVYQLKLSAYRDQVARCRSGTLIRKLKNWKAVNFARD